MRNARDALVVVAFALALAAPTVDTFVRDDTQRGPGPELREAAPPAEMPTDLATLSKFPDAFEEHFDDTFGLRDKLLRARNMVLYYAFAESPSANILVGREGWIFWSGDRSVDVFRGIAPLSADELAGWQYMLEGRARALSKIGCDYVWVVAPNKESIYPERMPERMHPIGPTRLDQFVAWMKEHSKVDVLDLRPALIAARQRDTDPYDAVCTPFGTHWTGRGSLVAAREIVDHLAATHPGAAPFDPDDILMQPVDKAADSLAGNLYMLDLLAARDSVPSPKEARSFDVLEQHSDPPERWVSRAHATNVLPPTVLFHDSFGPFVWPMLAANFEWLESYHIPFDSRFVDPTRTRIVIELFVERIFVTTEPVKVLVPDFVDAQRRFERAGHVLFDMAAKPEAGMAIGGMSVERSQIDGQLALSMTLQAAREGLEFGPVTLPATGEVLAHVDIDSPEPCLFDVAWRRSSAPKYLRSDHTTIALEPGRTEHAIPLPALGVDTMLLLRPRETGVKLTVRGFSVRASQ